MARYIDADKFKSNLEKASDKMHLIGGVKGVDVGAVIAALDRHPTADVVPKSEVERLRNILLQFTDIVHKWGAKNNIDTSEISLVPILQEESDSIIKKANQELASEIFAEIDDLDIQLNNGDLDIKYFGSAIAELKKKYTA